MDVFRSETVPFAENRFSCAGLSIWPTASTRSTLFSEAVLDLRSDSMSTERPGFPPQVLFFVYPTVMLMVTANAIV
jgi:hypothetical protein